MLAGIVAPLTPGAATAVIAVARLAPAGGRIPPQIGSIAPLAGMAQAGPTIQLVVTGTFPVLEGSEPLGRDPAMPLQLMDFRPPRGAAPLLQGRPLGAVIGGHDQIIGDHNRRHGESQQEGRQNRNER